MDNISFDIFNRHNEIITRYMELFDVENIEKLETSLVIISRSIQDINMQINAHNKGEKGVGVYYQLIIKTDILLGATNFLFNSFLNRSSMIVSDEIKNIINEFKMIRSLTIAHPLMTTRYEDFGFGKENDKWCEDVLPFSPYMTILKNNELQADYVLKYREKGTALPLKKFIRIEEHIIKPVYSILSKLDMITNRLEVLLERKIEDLKNEPILADKAMQLNDYIIDLKKDLKIRYPNEVAIYEYDIQNIEQPNQIEHSILDDALKRVNYSFQDPKQEQLYSIYKKKLIDVIHNYGDSVQNMSLDDDNSKALLKDMMFPSADVIRKLSDDEHIIYKLSKISYIQYSKEHTLNKVVEKMESYSEDDWRSPNKCSNIEFAYMQLWNLRDILSNYFPIDFTYSDDLVYIQYILALYFSQN